MDDRARAPMLAAGLLAVLLFAGCSAAAPPPPPTASPGPTTAAPAGTPIAGPVGIGDGRQLYLECRGSGSPTVVLISGTGGAADEWMSIIDPGDPSVLVPSDQSVFDELARTGRVCAYDRPGTTLISGSPDRSTPVAQPTTAAQDVADLTALLTAAGEQGPYVIVGASWGGLIAQLFARAHPEQTHGIALLDAASAYLQQTLTPAQWTAWMEVISAAHEKDPAAESPDYPPSIVELDAAGAMPRVPTVVISSDSGWDLGVTPGQSTWPAWTEAQRLLAESLGAEHIADTDSGHGLAVEQPALVAAAIQRIVERAG
ncbi:MAG TPA: alpha/beta hydrolase [Microbacterium sp.]|nr:alpha/beta hydrolase [Microbacterium sp.]